MSDVYYLSPRPNQCILSSHIEVLSRAACGTGVVSGNYLSPTSPASMSVQVDSGRIRIAGLPINVSSGSVELDAADDTLSRIDIIYRNSAGELRVSKGTPNPIEDPKGLSDWKSYTSPQPPETVPDGAILGAVYVAASTTSISSGDIWMFAGGSEDIATTIGTPGSDSMAASEKAIRTVLSSYAPASMGVTNGDSHDHSGGDGAQISHSSLSGKSNDDHTQYFNEARGDARYALLAHASRHKSGGADSIKIDELDAATDNTNLDVSTSKHGLMPKLPNTKQAFLGDGSWLTRTYDLEFQIDGGGSVITTGNKPALRIPIAGTIVAARIMAARGESNGSISIDVYKGTYANSPDSMSNIGTYTISSAKKSESTGLSISVSAGDWIAPYVASVSTFTAVTLSLTVTIT